MSLSILVSFLVYWVWVEVLRSGPMCTGPNLTGLMIMVLKTKKNGKKKKKNGQNSGKKSYIFDLNRATLLSNISPG